MTVSPWLVVAGALLGAGTTATLLALHPHRRDHQQAEQPDPVRQAAETSGLIPQPGGTS
ncbi:hypothetical protein [Kitasatospora sp. A2-31]|uniref:hypothetical protein n=1 Tax=Kitasatospora sp. A2-31 TaxID=2916414 RepID=UPI001EE8AD96|nr:hypothetical protein [Kitasatospora sp. A2-31]MCG6493406.1 hypothetical protein [Kitasatospora sp. A2-31]